jgi:hypothetical protein
LPPKLVEQLTLSWGCVKYAVIISKNIDMPCWVIYSFCTNNERMMSMRELKIKEVIAVSGAELQVMGDFVLRSSSHQRIYELPDEFDLIEMLYNRIFNPVDKAAELEAAQIEEYRRQGKIIVNFDMP